MADTDRTEGVLGRLSPAARIVLFLTVAVIAVTTPAGKALSFALYTAFLLMTAISARLSLRKLLFRLAAALPFIVVLLALVPFMPDDAFVGGHPSGAATRSALFLTLLGRSTISMIAVILLSMTTPFPRILDGLRALKVPPVLMLILTFAWRFVFVIRAEALRMIRAAESRLYRGRSLKDAVLVGRLLATLFLRSYERSERVYMAMVSRGFSGTLPGGRAGGITAADGVLLFLSATLLLAMRLVP